MVDIAKLATFAQSSPLPAWVATSKGDCMYANPALERLTGLDSDQINQADWPSLLLEEDRAAAAASWQSCLAIGVPYRARVRMRGFDGVPGTVELIAFGQKVGDGRELWLFVGLHVDSATQQQPQFEAQLQSTLNVIPAYTWYAGPSGALTFVNERTADYLGLPADDPLRFGIDIGGAWDAHIPLLHPDDQEESRRAWATCLRTGSAGEFSQRVPNAEGVYRWFLSRAEPLRASDGTLLYWVGVNLDIEERKQAEDALRKSEKELREVVDSIPALIHTARPDGYIDYFNKGWLEYFGVTLDDVAGWNWTAVVHVEDVEGILTRWQACLVTGQIFEYETRVRGANGEYRWMFHRKVPLRDADGNIVKWYGSSMDIHERKTAEEALRSSEAYLAEAQGLTHTGSFGWKPDSGEIVWSDETYRIFEYDRALKPTRDLLVDRVHPEDRSDFQKAIDVASAGAMHFEHNYRLLLPDGRVKYIHAIAHALQDASGSREFVGAGVDVTSIKRAEEELRKSEKELRDVIDTIPATAWSALPDGSNTYANKHFVEYSGLSAEQTAGSGWQAAIHPDDLERHVGKWREAVASSKPHENEVRLRRSDGQYRWHLDRGVPLRDEDGNIVKWYGVTTDIEDRKRAEEALDVLSRDLQESKAKLEEAQRIAHVGYWEWDLLTSRVNWSDETYRIYGMQPQERPIDIAACQEKIYPEDWQRGMEEALGGRARFSAECRVIRPTGEVRIAHFQGDVKRDASGKPYHMFGTIQDITDRKRAEEELRRREAYLAEAQRLSQTGSFGCKPDSGEIVWSDETYRIFEYDSALKPTIDLMVERVHPEDRADFQKVIDHAFAGGTDCDHAFRLLLPDGRVKHIHTIAHALQDASGNREFVGAATDVTSIKRAEEELRTSEAYLAEAQRLTHMGSWAWSVADRSAVHLSEEWYRIYGFNRAEGAPDWEKRLERVHPEDRLKWKGTLDRAILEKADYDVEFRIVLPDGTVKWVHTVGYPALNAVGELVEFAGSSMDITERKQAEQKLQAREVEFRQIMDLVPQMVAVFGPGGERLYANRIGLDYIGLSLEEWRQTPGAFFQSCFHPDDLERAARTYSDNARSGCSAYELELRLRKRDGTYRWFLIRFNPLRDEQGQITRWFVALTDIEDRKQAEELLRGENFALREEIDKASMFEEIVGTAPALQTVLSRISKVAPSDSTVLITGETGTGKELVARAIHRRSDRASCAFVSVNCAAIPRDLIASELFGHEKGAFTGATQQRLGRFELASGGTLFLDEVGELPAETQIALLRVLQEHEFERVGGTRPIRADVRVIAATNRDLQAAISTGSFRSDLYYRLHVFPIEIPSLRERKQDIPLLVEYFIDRYARKAGKKITTVDKKTLRLLESYPWPGNIRELQNVIERSIIVCETENFSVDESWLSKDTLPPTPRTRQSGALKVEVEPCSERETIEAALAETRGRVSGQSGAAARLGIPRSTLESRIRALKINKTRFKFG